MQTRCSEQASNTDSPENRKRKSSEETADAIQNLAKALRLEAEGNPNSTTGVVPTTVSDNPSQTVPKKSASKDGQSTSQSEEPTSELPSLHDSSAIQDFFRRNRQRSHQEYMASQSHLGYASSLDQIPNDPMRHIMEQSDKEMSVKEALAKGFRNYKVRLPKKRIPFELDPTIDTSVLYSLFANDDENYKDGTPATVLTSPQVSVRDALSVLSVSVEGNASSMTVPPSAPVPTHFPLPLPPPKTAESNRMDYDANASIKREPSDSPAAGEVLALQRTKTPEMTEEKPSIYTLPPFWKLPLAVSKGYRGGYYVRGLKYVQMTTLIHCDAVAVSLDIPIRFDMDGEIKTFTFNDLLLANGVAINDPQNCSEISKIFTTSVLLIHHSIAEHLLCNCGPNPLNPNAKLKLDCEPIPISLDLPPIVCHKPQYFGLALNSFYGPNDIFDPCKPSVTSPAVSESLPIFEDKKPCIEQPPPTPSPPPPPRNIPLTARQKGLVVTHFDTGASLEELATKFRVSVEDIEFIILNRAEVIRDQTVALMAENDMDDDRERVASNGGRRRNRVRRTSFVGLNILMWRFFKDCRDNGIVLNGKLLKEHAMMISRQLGLEHFKGSEGWLDAFKRRHRIDLKLMSGVPVNYEETDEDRMEDDHDDGHNNSSRQFNVSQIQSSSEGTTAALLNCVEKAAVPPIISAPVAVASIANTKPLDLINIYGSGETVSTDMQMNGFMDVGSSSGPRVSPNRMLLPQQLSPAPASDEKSYIAAIVKSAAIRVYDKELSSALETVRSYILSNDASAMPAFLELQIKLAVISREQVRRMKEEQATAEQSNPTAQNGGV